MFSAEHSPVHDPKMIMQIVSESNIIRTTIAVITYIVTEPREIAFV